MGPMAHTTKHPADVRSACQLGRSRYISIDDGDGEDEDDDDEDEDGDGEDEDGDGGSPHLWHGHSWDVPQMSEIRSIPDIYGILILHDFEAS